ncbi:MAG: (2Fe-2S)-binding protein, partial [Armatimonadetes bacterium]|nr:(2Fe-2S)-binding protein [Armatimonadota bacterium]
CGFCTPGMVLTTVALLTRTPNPSEAQVRSALEGNLCRCSAYHRIVIAVKDAAARMRRTA